MKTFSFICIIILFISPNFIFSQNYTNIFSDFLPQNFLTDEDKLEQAESNLNQFAKTNPDLIYYYLKYLNSITEQKIFNRDSNYYNILQYELSKSIINSNRWIEEELQKSDSLTESDLLNNELESIIEEFELPEKEIPEYTIELKVDTNFQKFLTYKCLTKNINLTYDDELNYQEKVEEEIYNLISEMKLDYKSNEINYNSNREYKIDEFHQHNLFSKGFSNGQKRKLDLPVSEYLLSLINFSDFIEYSGIHFGFNTEALEYTFPIEKVSEPYLPFEEFSLTKTKEEMIFYSINAGYRLKLKEYKSAFSHLDLNIGLNIASEKVIHKINSLDINKPIFVWDGEPTNFIYSFLGTINSVSWDVNNFTSLAVNLDIPFYYYNNKLFIDVGVLYKFLMSEYSVIIERTIREQSSVDPTILGPEIEHLKHKSKNHLFGGSLSLNYTLLNSLNFKGSISTLGSIYFGLDYLFRF